MKTIWNILIAGLIILAIKSPIKAQELIIGTEVRPRIEYRHGFGTLADTLQAPACYIEQRTRLNVAFNSKFVRSKVVVQDVRTWGSQPQLVTADGNTTTIHEAWAQVFFHKRFSMKLGRQEISYDDQRIFGSVDWAQQARSHDALLLIYQDSLTKVHVGVAYNQNAPASKGTIYTVPKSYKTFQYLWANRNFGFLNLSVLFLNNGQQVYNALGNVYTDSLGIGRTSFTQTVGARLGFKKFGITANLAGYYQGGRDSDTTQNMLGKPISSYYIGADVSYTIASKYTIGVGVEILSGNNKVFDPNNTAVPVNNAFNPFYGTNHKFNGHMDYFYVGNHAGNVGLNDIFLNFKALLGKNGRGFVSFDAHVFMANNNIADKMDATKAIDPFLGVELDLYGGFTINEWANVKIGYSQLFASSSMEVLKGGNKNVINNWAWLMISVSPSGSISLKKKEA